MTNLQNKRRVLEIYHFDWSKVGQQGTWVNKVFLGSTQIATVSNNAVRYYFQDHLGSANAVTDSAGTLIELMEYKPFGDFSRHTKYGGNENVAWYYFTGKPLDDETGLIYFGARYYSPILGRFITPDTIVQGPMNPQTLNRYSYCNNNPINLVDPTGHFFWFAAIVGAIVGATIGGVTAAITHQSIWQGIVFGALSGAGAGFATLSNTLVWGALTGAGSAAASGGNPLIGAGLGAFGAGLGRGAASFLGANANHFARGVASTLVGGVTGGVGAVATGGEFGKGFAYGAAGGLAGYGLSVGVIKTSTKLAQWVLEKEINTQLKQNNINGDVDIEATNTQPFRQGNHSNAYKIFDKLGFYADFDIVASGLVTTEEIKFQKVDLALTVQRAAPEVKLSNLGLGTKVNNMDHLFNFKGVIHADSSNKTYLYGLQWQGSGTVKGDFYAVTNLNQQLNFGLYRKD